MTTTTENNAKEKTKTKSKPKTTSAGAKKNFILDTNVILHDYKCLDNFEENDIYLPFVVLEELDKFKKGNDQINFNARAFVRELDLITDDDLFTDGADLGVGRGKLYIVNAPKVNQKITEAFPENTPDHRILSVVSDLGDKYPKQKCILITKDINLRMKARSLGILAEDYITDKVTDVDLFDQSEMVIENINGDLIDRLYAAPTGIDIDEFNFDIKLDPNQCFILKSDRNSALARYNPFTERIKKWRKRITMASIHATRADLRLRDIERSGGEAGGTHRESRNRKNTARAGSRSEAEQDIQSDIAGTTHRVAFKQRFGLLAGDEKQKIAPYMQPLFDNLNVIKSQLGQNSSDLRLIDELQKTGQLEIEALAFIRGRSLTGTFCIIDEAQNLTPHEVKTIITRAGEGTKMVFTGDLQQIDSPYLDTQSNGLAYMIDKMKGQNLFAHVNLVKGERSELSELASNLL